MAHQTLNVEGMSCNHCVESIHNTLNEIIGVQKAFVNLEEKEVRIDYNELKVELNFLINKIKGKGFEVLD